MLGAYVGASTLKLVPNLWLAALITGGVVAAFGFVLEKLLLRKLAGQCPRPGAGDARVSFIIADFCLVVWGGDPIPVPTRSGAAAAAIRRAGVSAYRLAVVVISVVTALLLYLLMERTRWAR